MINRLLIIFGLNLFIYSHAHSYVELSCGDYRLVGKLRKSNIVLYEGSLSHKSIGNVFDEKDLEKIKKLGIPEGGVISADIYIRSLKENYVTAASVLDIRTPKREEIISIDRDVAVILMKKRPCQK